MAAHRCVILLRAVALWTRRVWRTHTASITTLHVQQTALRASAAWLVIMPLLVWLVATVYVPLIAPFLSPLAVWSIALVAVLLLGASLLGHVLAHVSIARLLRSDLPPRVPLYPFGDAAQVWPAARTPHHEALIALSGPGFNLLIALAAYHVWDRQLHVGSDVVALLLACVNMALAVLNMTPGFPLDGGRLTRAIVWWLLNHPALGTRLARRLGGIITGAGAGWGVLLLLERSRFSGVTGLGTLGVAAVLGFAAWRHGGWHDDRSPQRPLRWLPVRGLITGVLIVGLLGIAGSLVPTTHGIRMPGGAVAIEPMISVPDMYRSSSSGSFLMTTVFEQTPIVAGQWVYAYVDPASQIVTPDRIVPTTVTPQEHIRYSYQLLQQSERTATIVALRLAGYHTVKQGTMIEVVDVRPGSWASPSLQPGDRILRVNGAPLHDDADLFTRLNAHDPAMPLNLDLVRNSMLLQLNQTFTPSTDAAAAPDIVVRAGEPYADAPFSVMITPQKIVGGPSVGLMFTLTAYDMLTPDDLTHGRRIAGTGTIDWDGRVGPIGGVAQKVAAAEAAGAEYFLVPVANADDARAVARRITVLEVETAEHAIELLRTLQPNESQS